MDKINGNMPDDGDGETMDDGAGSPQEFDTANCRVMACGEHLVECLTPQSRYSCNSAIPFADTFFCKHPLLSGGTDRPA